MTHLQWDASTAHQRFFEVITKKPHGYSLLCFVICCRMIFSPALAAEIMPPAAHPLIMQCITDLAQRCHCPVEEIITVAVETTTWPDTALGLPEYGKMYAQTPTPGWRLVLKARGYDYLYRFCQN